MAEVGIRALKQNSSAVVARVASGEVITITERGHAVAEMIPIAAHPLAQLIASGRARAPRRNLADLPAPVSGHHLSEALTAMRDDERY